MLFVGRRVSLAGAAYAVATKIDNLDGHDRIAVSGEGQDAPSVDEMARGQRFLVPNQAVEERIPAWSADVRAYSLWIALRVTLTANLGQSLGNPGHALSFTGPPIFVLCSCRMEGSRV
jgi:hypothetical protein